MSRLGWSPAGPVLLTGMDRAAGVSEPRCLAERLSVVADPAVGPAAATCLLLRAVSTSIMCFIRCKPCMGHAFQDDQGCRGQHPLCHLTCVCVLCSNQSWHLKIVEAFIVPLIRSGRGHKGVRLQCCPGQSLGATKAWKAQIQADLPASWWQQSLNLDSGTCIAIAIGANVAC